MRSSILGSIVGAAICVACRGTASGGGDPETETTGMNDSTGGGAGGPSGGTETGDPTGAGLDGVGPGGLRRLTRRELDNTVRDILGDDTRPASQVLPEDALTPFDNEYALQEASQPLVEALELLARDAAQRLLDDPARRDRVVGCTPEGPVDEGCLRSFVDRFGRRALRRRLASDELDDFVALGREFAEREDDFYAGVAVVVRALLQDGELVYRLEQGTPVEGEAGFHALGDFEIATRLSFLVWGTTPDDALLDAAEAGELHTPEQLEDMARQMLLDPRAREQIDRFHAMWLGYAQLPHPPELTNAMRSETSALVERVVLDEQRPWIELFTATETFVDASLAEHYGLPSPAGEGPQWVSYGSSGRQGLLSHGSFLSVAAGPGDTSPVRRGKLIREQLMCQPIPPPPPGVDADTPPPQAGAECKWDRYAAHREVDACAACHDHMDLVGFGLERYDRQGRYRTHDEGAPQCVIAGDGELVGLGSFSGPAELSDRLLDAGLLPPCVARQLHRFALGREAEPAEMPWVLALAAVLTEGDGRFDTMLIALVTHPAFTHRRDEE